MTLRAKVERGKVERGDWQTPIALAESVLDLVARCSTTPPRAVIEPTCGKGAFLVAASRRFPRARLYGYEIDAAYVREAREALAKRRGDARSGPAKARIVCADFFELAWERELEGAEQPLLIVGNPPWVTSARLGVLGSVNRPAKRNALGLRGLEAVTGKSNFDVSEWMILRLLESLVGRRATIAILCKAAVARKVVETVARRALPVLPVGLWRVDATEHFDASVAAVLLVAETRQGRAPSPSAPWPVYGSFEAKRPESSLGVVDGVLVADDATFARTRHLAGPSASEWRSGVKHDCARVMELRRAREGGRSTPWINGLGETVDIEDELTHPFLKSSDVANDRAVPSRALIVPQRALGEETSSLRRRAPRAWRYLTRHRALLDARKSSIYSGRPPFAIFGVGPYSFAPWKVAVSGLYKRASFTVVGPHEGRAVLLDDTCYFLPFDDEAEARRVAHALSSTPAREFFEARVFWDAKRPITKAVLQALDLAALTRALSRP